MGFKKTVEDFTCEQCGAYVEGDGHTNHCPKCLWSKHVDTSPGDRVNICRGLMKPMRAEGTVASYFVIHECVRCGAKTRNTFGKKDSIEALIHLARKASENGPIA
jgi:hypothetical protein